MTKSELKIMLSSLSEKEKDLLLLKLFKNASVKKAIEGHFGLLDLDKLYKDAKKKIDANIFGRSGYVLKKGEAKKAISVYYKDTKDYACKQD